MKDWFPDPPATPGIFYSQEKNVYMESRGPVASMAYRPYPVTYPLSKSVPLEWYDFGQERYTYGVVEPDQDVDRVWNLQGTEFEVMNLDGILFYEGETLQKNGVFQISYPAGFHEDLDFQRKEDGRILIGDRWYMLTGSKLDRPLDVPVPSGTPYLCFGSVYCFRYVNTQAFDTPFPGAQWTTRPVSYILPNHAAAYADLFPNSWYVPIPFPKKTFVEKLPEPKANGYAMRAEVTRINYDRYGARWAGTFPMAHSMDNSLPYGTVRTRPLTVRLKHNYRMEVKEW